MASRRTRTSKAPRWAAARPKQADLLITSWLLDGLAGLTVLLILIVFQPELRRMVLDLDGVVRHLRHLWGGSPQQAATITEACFGLAAAHLGALLVLVRRDAIRELLDGGVTLQAEMSAPLLIAIFQKDSPLHDGAVIIERERITRANVVLPLTQRREVPGAYGTRHRAGMGLAERCDALLIVVSEERGTVTVMDGPVAREVDPAELRDALQHATRPVGEPLAARFRPAAWADLPLMLGALGLTAMLWSLSFVVTGATVRTVSVPIAFRNVPVGLELAEQSTDMLDLQVRGRPVLVDALNPDRLIAHVDLGALGPGQHTLPLTPRVLALPPGVAVVRTTPASLRVRLAPLQPSRHP